MVFETEIYLGKKSFNVIIGEGFYRRHKILSTTHKHRYGEIHLISGGNAKYEINGKTIVLKRNEGVFIPPDMFHRCLDADDNAYCIAFQIVGGDFGEMRINSFIESTVNGLRESAESFFKRSAEDELILYLSLIVSGFNRMDGEKAIVPVKNREFLIYEFFANNYNRELALNDIANELHLSEKQASRMIEKYMGNNFRTEILKRKMEAAKYLIETEKMSLEEVAAAVGYSSYAGFWKAFTSFYNK